MASSDQDETSLLCLDDNCLLHILKHLSPLPDLFAVARSCWRFRKLATGEGSWLRVGLSSPAGDTKVHPTSFATLAEAVRASRPGQTIWLAPYVEHHISDLVVGVPIHLLGGGEKPEDTRLVCPRGVNGLDFRATCLLANLSIHGTIAPCIVHHAGQLSIERCVLECDSAGLSHLCSPVVTHATCQPAPRLGPAAGPMSVPAPCPAFALHVPESYTIPPQHLAPRLDHCPPQEGLRPWTAGAVGGMPTASRAAAAAAGLGRLCVSETRITGGGKAVQCLGTGSLQAVRVIYAARGLPLFFFEVDCRYPGHRMHSMEPSHQVPPTLLAGAATPPMLSGTPSLSPHPGSFQEAPHLMAVTAAATARAAGMFNPRKLITAVAAHQRRQQQQAQDHDCKKEVVAEQDAGHAGARHRAKRVKVAQGS
mmetsp:Transcript_12358/g.26697  ORF Transcript_12358/g.26697 Transcript_12358/m.26697 type:complete len:422 (+) Transcript_12358:74-1339(+)